MRYAGIIKNDIASGPGICVSFFTQGCPFHCKGCHNPETWDYDGGYRFTYKTMESIIEALQNNGIKRNLSIVGGEPLCDNNIPLVYAIIKRVKKEMPDIKINMWTGFTYESLKDRIDNNNKLKYILNNINYLIDGRYVEELRDITLYMRGSSNQRILDMKETLKNDEPCIIDYGEVCK